MQVRILHGKEHLIKTLKGFNLKRKGMPITSTLNGLNKIITKSAFHQTEPDAHLKE
jgi:hypothetical protein